MIENSMYHVFLVHDQNNPDAFFYLLQNHSRFTLAQVKDCHRARPDIMDKYEFQDLKYSGDYLQESVIVDLLYQVHQEVRKDATSPVTCVAAMRTLSSNGYDAIEE